MTTEPQNEIEEDDEDTGDDYVCNCWADYEDDDDE